MDNMADSLGNVWDRSRKFVAFSSHTTAVGYTFHDLTTWT